MYELCVELPEPRVERQFDHYAARRLGELLVWIRFSPTRLPSRVERYTQIEGVEVAEEIPLGGGTGAHVLARGFGPGILGVRWHW